MDTKKCPFCAEEILVAAVQCEHCGGVLDGSTRSAASPNPASGLSDPAFLLFLSRFTQPNSLENQRPAAEWEAALGVNLSTAIARLVHEGFVRPVELDLPRLLSWQFGSGQLKAMAKERGLVVSGTKEILGKRLAEADALGMAKLIRHDTFFVCTERGLAVAEKFKASQKAKREEAERDTLHLLKSGHLEEACLRVTTFEAGRGLPNLSILTRIISAKPKRFALLPAESLSKARVAAAMTHLWAESYAFAGRWIEEPDGWDEIYLAARGVLAYASNEANIARCKEFGYKRVKVCGSSNPMCEECTRENGKVYDIGMAPEIPHEKCTCEEGCPCGYLLADKRPE